MNWRPRLKIYKSNTGNNTFNPESIEARSYGHWCYFKEFSFPNGKKLNVFNNHNYSMTTCNHQIECRYLLKNLGIHIHFEVNTEASLENYSATEITKYKLECLYKRIFEIEALSMLPKKRKKTIEDLIKDHQEYLLATVTIETITDIKLSKEELLKLEEEVFYEVWERNLEPEAATDRPEPIRDDIKQAFNSLDSIELAFETMNSLQPLRLVNN